MFFPPDVSTRVIGDEARAQALFPAAAQLLFRAINMQGDGKRPVHLSLRGADGSLIRVFLHQGLKHVYVSPPPPPSPQAAEVPPQEVLVSIECITMLNGLVRPGARVQTGTNSATGDPLYAVHEFHPTAEEVEVYGIDDAWQDSDRLDVAPNPVVSPVDTQVRWPKPSMYSGAMTRVVQAIYGIANTSVVDTDGIETKYEVKNNYDFRWARCDGLYKDADGKWFVIRIGAADGVLKMALPLFDCTTDDVFLDALRDIGDLETASVVEEFGGLPTGESFPDDAAELEDAIEVGLAERLLPAAALIPFYASGSIAKSGLTAVSGWAFSDSGGVPEVHNTCFWYSNQAAATAQPDAWDSDGFNGLPLADRVMRAEHWKIDIAHPALILVEASLMVGESHFVSAYRTDLPFIRVPGPSDGERVFPFEFWGRLSGEGELLDPTNPVKDITSPVWVFFDSDDLVVVRHQPSRNYPGGARIRGPWVETSDLGIAVNSADDLFFEHGFTAIDVDTQFQNFFSTVFYVIHAVYNLSNGALASFRVSLKIVPQEIAQSTLDYYSPSGLDITFNEDGGIDRTEQTVDYRLPMRRSGRFYTAYLDERSNKQQSSLRTGFAESHVLVYADAWQEEVGLVILPGCRDGVMFAHYFGGATDPEVGDRVSLAAGIAQKALIPSYADGPTDFRTLPSEHVNYGTDAASAGTRWNSAWTSILNYVFAAGITVNAGPSKLGIAADGIYRPIPHELDGFLSGPDGLGVPTYIIDLPAAYVGSAGGIPIVGCTAGNSTFVGAVQ